MNITIGKLTIDFSLNFYWEKPYMREVKNALREGRKLLAVKIYKDATGLGLKESKDAIDALCPKYLKDYKPKWFSNPEDIGLKINDYKSCIYSEGESSYWGVFTTPAYVMNGEIVPNKRPVFIGKYKECVEFRKQNTSKDNEYVTIPLSNEDVNKYIYDNPNPKSMFGVCDAIDFYSSSKPPKILFVGDFDQCLEWKAKNGLGYTIIGLSDEEVNKYMLNELTTLRDELSQPRDREGNSTR